jgi:isoleucyl-tRNA synthetase
VIGTQADSLAIEGERLLISADGLERAAATFQCAWRMVEESIPGHLLSGATVREAFPLPDGFAKAAQGVRLVLPGAFVTSGQGTGFVHIAPAHGEDDFQLAQDVFSATPSPEGPASLLGGDGPGFPQVLGRNGVYLPGTPVVGGMHIFKEATTKALLEHLQANGRLLHSARFRHSYPHSWRSKKPLIYWAVPGPGSRGNQNPPAGHGRPGVDPFFP